MTELPLQGEGAAMKYGDFDLTDGTFELPAGERAPAGTLHVWTQDGFQWACRAYDHGPFCRRCTRLDTITAAMVANVVDGLAELIDDPERGLSIWLNAAGRAKVETAIRRGGFSQGLDS